jgi:hypothetical protein
MTDAHFAAVLHIATFIFTPNIGNLSAALNSTVCPINFVSSGYELYNLDSYPFLLNLKIFRNTSTNII